MGFLDKIISGGIGEAVEKIGGVVDKFITTDKEREEMKQALQAELNRHDEAISAAANTELDTIVKDIDSARKREIDIATSEKAPLINKIIQPVLAILTVFLTFILYYMVLFKKIEPGTEKDIVIFVLGALTAIDGQIYSYYFGSSTGSARKQTQLENLTKK